jgi:hypothetical protein
VSDDRPSEGAPGWALLGCGVVFGIALPVWSLLTIAVMQLSPELNGLGADVVERPGLGAWIAGGWIAATWMAAASPAFLAVLAMFGLSALASRRRGRADRDRLDALVAADAVLDSPGWAPAAHDEADHSSE